MSGRGGFGVPSIADRIHSIPVEEPNPGEHRTVPIGDIVVRAQVREVFDREKLESLKAVIQRDGQRQPVECYREDGVYVLLTGERRYRAVKELGKPLVEVMVRKKPEPTDAIYLQLSENEDREPLTRIELAKAISALDAAGEKAPDIAKRLGMGAKQVPRYRAIGNASEKVHALYDQGVMDIRSLEILANIEKKWPEGFEDIAQSVASGSVGRAELESLFGRLKKGEPLSSVIAQPAQQAASTRDVIEPVSASEQGARAETPRGGPGQEAESTSAGAGGDDLAGQEAPPEGAEQGRAPMRKEGDDIGKAQVKKQPTSKQDKSGIRVDHHYEQTHLAATPEGIVIEVKGKLDNGTQVRGTLLMDRVDEASEFMWIKPDDAEASPVKLEAKRVKIVSVTGR